MQTDDWHYVRGEQQFGPVPFQVLQTLARSGDLEAEDLVWCEGMPDWVAAQSIQGLFAPAFQPRSRGGGRAGGRRRSSGRPASRRPGRAFGDAPGAPPAAPPGVFGAPTYGQPGVGESAAERADRRRSQMASGTPAGIVFAAILDLLVIILLVVLGVFSMDHAEESRRLAHEQTDQALTNYYWEMAATAETQAIIQFVIAGVFLGVALVLLTGQTWGPIAQTIISLLASLPFFLALGDLIEMTEHPQLGRGFEFLLLVTIGVLVFLLAPIGCVWTKGVQDWLKAKSGGGASPRRGRRAY